MRLAKFIIAPKRVRALNLLVCSFQVNLRCWPPFLETVLLLANSLYTRKMLHVSYLNLAINNT